MQRFHIAPPSKGRTTATLLAYPYDRKTQRTKALYLGSFSVNLDPSCLPIDGFVTAGSAAFGVRLAAGREVDGRPFEIHSAGLSKIRAWLTAHGTFLPSRLAEEAARASAERERAQAQKQLRSDMEALLRPEIEQEVRQRLEAESLKKKVSWLERAIEAVGEASREVVTEADRLRALGVRLTSVRAISASPGPRTELDRLQERANFLRLTCHVQFEEACKEAKLMGQRHCKG